MLSRLQDDLADEVQSGGKAVPVIPAASWRTLLLHAVIIPSPTAVSGICVHTVLVTVPVVWLTRSPGNVPAVSTHFTPRTDPCPAVLVRHVVSARPYVSAAPLRCNGTQQNKVLKVPVDLGLSSVHYLSIH